MSSACSVQKPASFIHVALFGKWKLITGFQSPSQPTVVNRHLSLKHGIGNQRRHPAAAAAAAAWSHGSPVTKWYFYF